MELHNVLMIVMTILVALLTTGVWGILFALAKSRSNVNEERSGAIKAIAEECGEAEKILSSQAARSMNAHGLKSALGPRVEKLQKMLTASMHLLDVYFVKYVESRIAVFQAAFASGETAFPIDKFLTESKPAAGVVDKQDVFSLHEKPGGSVTEAVAHDLRERIEAVPQRKEPAVEAKHPAKDLSRETALVKEKDVEKSVEPPDLDLRTGIITIAPEDGLAEKTVERQPAMEKTAELKLPPPQPKKIIVKKKPEPPTPAKPAEAEEIFDFEKAISARMGQALGAEPQAKETQTEKTMKWDRDELHGMAGKPEAIVVEGSETEAKHDEPMISGEDIENTLDSFFGLGGR